MKTLVYLAAPYTHDDPAVRLERFNRINASAGFLMRAGIHIFSPISECHPIAMCGGLPTDWQFWAAYDEEMLAACRALVVLMLPGWDKSTGVGEETKIAHRLGLVRLWTHPDEESLAKVVCARSVGGAVEVVR